MFKRIFSLIFLFLITPSLAWSSETITETQYILNSFLLLVCGALVMFMAAGFAMLGAGMVQSRSVASIVLKNISLYSVASLMYYFVGYNLMYTDVDGGWIGKLAVWSGDDSKALSGDYSAGYAAYADWFFQMVFVATTASIISGTLAERVRIEPFLIFVLLLTGFLYPITGSWKWGGGWLDEMGFLDFAGSTIVHSVGGFAALTGAIILGPRAGRFDADGKPNDFRPSAITLVGLGTFVLWLGWFGFNGGSQLAMATAGDAIAIGTIFANTNTAAAAGVISAMLISHWRFGRIDVYQMLNGALAGLVAITAEPLTPQLWQAMVIGATAGAILTFSEPLLLRFKIDDVVGAIPVHLFCGIFGTLVVPWTNPDASFTTQLIGVVSIGGFILVASTMVWILLKSTMGLILSEDKQYQGADISELGVHAYPYFGQKH
jgi:Amt family ammonium transporter